MCAGIWFEMRKSDMRRQNPIWDAKIRYETRKSDMSRENPIWNAKIRFGKWECEKRKSVLLGHHRWTRGYCTMWFWIAFIALYNIIMTFIWCKVRVSLYLAGWAAEKMELTRRCLLCWRCCLLAFLYFTNTVHNVHGLSEWIVCMHAVFCCWLVTTQFVLLYNIHCTLLWVYLSTHSLC